MIYDPKKWKYNQHLFTVSMLSHLPQTCVYCNVEALIQLSFNVAFLYIKDKSLLRHKWWYLIDVNIFEWMLLCKMIYATKYMKR